MDDIIQKLIEFDRQCVDSQQNQVEKHKQDLLNKNKEEAQLQENEFHKSMKNMEDLFTQNKDKWVDEIFTRCTK